MPVPGFLHVGIGSSSQDPFGLSLIRAQSGNLDLVIARAEVSTR